MKKLVLVVLVLISFNAQSQTSVPLASVQGVQVFEKTENGMVLSHVTEKGDNISYFIESVQYDVHQVEKDGSYVIFVELVNGKGYIEYDSPEFKKSNRYFIRLLKRLKRKVNRR